jgi:hypothetical protein
MDARSCRVGARIRRERSGGRGDGRGGRRGRSAGGGDRTVGAAVGLAPRERRRNARRQRPARQHRVEGRLDAGDMRGLVGEVRIVVVDQHRRIDLEDQQIAVAVERAIDAEELQPDDPGDLAQRRLMRGAEHRAGMVESAIAR